METNEFDPGDRVLIADVVPDVRHLISRATAYRILPAQRLGRRRLVRLADVERLFGPRVAQAAFRRALARVGGGQ